MPQTVNESREKPFYRSFWRLPLVVLLSGYLVWNITVPTVIVHYSEDAVEPLSVVWNTQHRIYRVRVPPGSGTADYGHIFPNEDFFMVFDFWTGAKSAGCVRITAPQWRTTNIYVGGDAKIDMSYSGGTDIDRLRSRAGT